jgi:hypothetical protein
VCIFTNFMNKRLIIFSAALLFAACNTATPTVNTNVVVANASNAQRGETVIAHSTENQTPPMPDSNTTAGSKSKWTQSGEPIDTKAFDADIAKADKTAKSKPNDASAKKALGEAYLKRAVALTEARQYASALGDYRRALKYDPENAEAKQWVDQIIQIYDSMGRESPPEGQEPPPLPYTSTAAQNSTRITFRSGADSTVVSGTLNGYSEKRNYVIAVRQGQTLSTGQDGDQHDITIFIQGPSGENVGDSDASCNNRREITPTVAGDYKIQVVECQKADAWRGTFRFRVTVR